MATTAKEASNGKQKVRSTPSAPQNIDIPHGRRTPKSSVAGSPDGGTTTPLSEKPTPHYLKHTISSAKDVCKYGKKQAHEGITSPKGSIRRKSFEKPPSPSQLQRTLSANFKERTFKPSSTSHRTTSSSKPILDRTSKPKPKILKKSTSMGARKATTSSTTATPTCPAIIETPPEVQLEQEDNAIQVQEAEQEEVEVEKEIQIQLEVEVPPAHDQMPIDPIDSESSNPCDSSTLPEEEEEEDEEEELVPAPQIEETKEKGDEQTENDKIHEDEEQSKKNENNNDNEVSSDHPEESLEGKPQDKYKEEEEKFQKKDEDGDVEGVKNAKAENVNVVLKRQDVKGKKGSQAYNDVIEETASKLVEKRKSKVRALVGAFETVISLQEPEGQQSQQTEGGGTRLTESSSS